MHSSNIHIKIFTLFILTAILISILSPNFLFAQSREIVAKNGDGIHKILRNNGLDPAKYTNAFIELNKTRIGKDNTLLIGVKYRLPDAESKITVQSVGEELAATTPTLSPTGTKTAPLAAGKTMRYDIFGSKYANVEIKSNELKGAVYYLKSGHGGPDPGAMGNYQGNVVCEDEYAYDVTLRLARNLMVRGATVYMITIDKNDGIRDVSFLKADKDEVCYPNLPIPLNHVKRLQQRVNTVNKLYGKHKKSFQRFISIHVDSRSKGENIDIFFYHDAKSKTGKKAATTLQKTFHAKYNEHQPGRGYHGTVTSRNLYVLKNSYPAGVYIELANMNHQRDIKRLIIPDNRQAVANWLADGLVIDFKNNK
ncbi:MAG: N-acetylmuramoyl-L-alanine [Prolixibacteraceae bacterium]|nr:MAG: N-acetylmuramoyl-L-alanine [Prolixibacteraceae bacterium]